jgi:hypothetical protein
MYINIPKNPTVLASDLRIAHTSKDRRRVCQLIEAVPADRWIHLDGPEAVASYGGARIAARSYGGDGIGSYERVCLDVLWPDLTIDFLGEYTAQELQLPNYRPRRLEESGQERPSTGIVPPQHDPARQRSNSQLV